MTSQHILDVDAALLGPAYETAGPTRIVIDGARIASLSPLPEPPGTGLFAIPSLADAHNHARPLSTTSLGCGGKPLEAWLPQLAVTPSADPYTAAAASFGRSLAGGATSVMVHLTRPMGGMSLPEEAREIARAAHDVGVSIGFAVALRDRNPLVYGDAEAVLAPLSPETRALAREIWLRPLPSVADHLALVDAVAEAVADAPGHVDVQYGPNSVQWCSDALLAGIAEASARTGRRVHMHLLETAPQRDWADRTYPDGIVAHLENIGLLSHRLTLAHCVWARKEELARIAAAGARIAVNASSNLHLYSGIAPVPAMLDAGVDVAMGLDGCALDEDDDGLRELRLFHLLNHARGYGDGGLTPQTALRAACATGRAGLGLEPGGVIAPGAPADLLLLSLARLDRDALMPVDPASYLFARGEKGDIIEAFSRGRQVIADGRLTGVDLDALQDRLRREFRAGLAGKADLIAAFPEVERGIADFYKGCC
ncbi:amidohydrolase family protein [Aliiruegeria lutimaris]|uniref:Cytosine/adenosine deaminase n=1 Tax=Aliiruegeria lutimaris TaxID=571298 RepID=A0A1G8RQ17_9RHOB|nr:amidohydrolase family protein [Aliiruegeria lutimaris]SDJ18605.1 Cytosine/adenosine deaminase [Aliiruegeria lutimaris]